MRTHLLSPLALLLLTSLPACGWFASPDPTAEQSAAPVEQENQDPAANMPKCRPTDAVEQRGEIPFKQGEATPSGWAVSQVNAENFEYIRVSYTKAGTETIVEIAFNEGVEGDWATSDYRLMPAPGNEPPAELLTDIMASLRAWQTTHDDTPFVVKKAGVLDPYVGLPPCGPDGKPI